MTHPSIYVDGIEYVPAVVAKPSSMATHARWVGQHADLCDLAYSVTIWPDRVTMQASRPEGLTLAARLGADLDREGQYLVGRAMSDGVLVRLVVEARS